MTTDTDALTERIARALFEVRDDAYDLDKWEDLDSTDRERWMCDAAAVLPIVAEEVRKAKAEALREAALVMGEWACESLVVIGDQLDESTWVEMTAGEWLEHRAAEYESGDSDEHR